MDLTDKSQLIKYLKQNGLWASKKLGQNFLVDRGVLDKIVAAAQLSKNDTVLEIGPGLGVLTSELIKHAGRIIAVEKDRKLADLIKSEIRNSKFETNSKSKNLNSKRISELTDNKLTIINSDVLDFEAKSYKLEANSYKLVANIPYYITGKILEKFLATENRPSLIVLLVQKEVAERICAKEGEHSVLSISVQYYGQPEIISVVKASSFFPEPNVDSAILMIKLKNTSTPLRSPNRRATAGQADLIHRRDADKDLFRIVKAGFRARRKTLINNLKMSTNLNAGQIGAILDKMGLGRNVRAQELSVAQWIALVEKLRRIVI